MTDSVSSNQGGSNAGTGTRAGSDNEAVGAAQEFEAAILDQIAFSAVFDGYSEEQRMRQKQKEMENENRTV